MEILHNLSLKKKERKKHSVTITFLPTCSRQSSYVAIFKTPNNSRYSPFPKHNCGRAKSADFLFCLHGNLIRVAPIRYLYERPRNANRPSRWSWWFLYPLDGHVKFSSARFITSRMSNCRCFVRAVAVAVVN